MEENVPLLKKQNVAANANTDNGDLNMVASISGCQTSLQTNDVDELQTLLDKAQTVLKNQSEETSVSLTVLLRIYAGVIPEVTMLSPAQQFLLKPSFLPRWLIRYLLVLSIIWQLVCIGVLSVVDVKTKGTSSHHTARVVSDITLTTFTAVHLIVVILISMRVAAKVATHTASFVFLIQAYLSTVLLFSGLYTLCTRFECRSFRHIDQRGGANYCKATDEIILIDLFVRLLFFSVSNSTLCGITDIQPNKWYTELTVAFQMLLSFLYFASILTHGYHKTTSHQPSIWERSALLKMLKRFIIKVSS